MSGVTVIPAGYRLSVTTWENDGDNYKTKVIEGLSRELLMVYVTLAKAFIRNYSVGRDQRICNLYEPCARDLERLGEAYDAIALEHQAALLQKFHDPNDRIPDDYRDWVSELAYDIGIEGQGEFHTRVVESFKIEHIAEPITLNDVTEDFT